jgi:hypothetical protein
MDRLLASLVPADPDPVAQRLRTTATTLRMSGEANGTDPMLAPPLCWLKPQVGAVRPAFGALDVVHSWKQAGRTRTKSAEAEDPAGQTLFAAGSRIATHST